MNTISHTWNFHRFFSRLFAIIFLIGIGGHHAWGEGNFLDSKDGVKKRVVYVDNKGKVGIGMIKPFENANLDVLGLGTSSIIIDSYTADGGLLASNSVASLKLNAQRAKLLPFYLIDLNLNELPRMTSDASAYATIETRISKWYDAQSSSFEFNAVTKNMPIVFKTEGAPQMKILGPKVKIGGIDGQGNVDVDVNGNVDVKGAMSIIDYWSGGGRVSITGGTLTATNAIEIKAAGTDPSKKTLIYGAGIRFQDGTQLNSAGDLVHKNDLGNIRGKDGTNGKDGANGNDGKNGINGANGNDGKNGVSITAASLSTDGNLMITLSDGKGPQSVGKIVQQQTCSCVFYTQKSGTNEACSIRGQGKSVGGIKECTESAKVFVSSVAGQTLCQVSCP